MAFLHARQNSQIKLSAKEMFEISQEISQGFSPIILSTMPGFAFPKRLPANNLTEIAKDREPVRLMARGKLTPAPQVKVSPQELLEISREISQKFAPKLASGMPEGKLRLKLSAQELLRVSEEIRREFAPRLTDGRSVLMLLPVDPWHLHAYWKIDQNEVEAGRQTKPGRQLTLRIYPEVCGPIVESESTTWFDIAIDSLQGQQKVELPDRSGASHFSAVIGKIDSDPGFTVYQCSNVIHVPRSNREEPPYLDNRNAPGGLPILHKHASGLGK